MSRGTRRNRSTHIAFYGNVAMERGWCPECEDYAFVMDGNLVCCNTPPSEPPKFYKRICEPEQHRHHIPPSVKQQILEEQENRCYYCEREFGSIVYRRGKAVRLQLHWDHFVPYSYSQDNHQYNFVGSCHVCNGIKTDMLFQTREEAQIYILDKWTQKGYI